MISVKSNLRSPTAWSPELRRAQLRNTCSQASTLYERLVACHGKERADAIVAGTDEATNADLAAWKRVGAAR